MMNRAMNLSLASFALAPVSLVAAQPCEPGWHVLGGVNNRVFAMTVWDPDGPGPQPALIVVGGSFTQAGGAPAHYIATLDLIAGTWGTLGAGLDGRVLAVEAMSDGDLVAGGLFRRAGEAVVNGIARWDGSAWHPLGVGVSGFLWPSTGPNVWDLMALPSGELVAGGSFTHAGGVEVNGIARWDGAQWWPLAGGTDSTVGALANQPDGSLLAGLDEPSIMRWDGASWAHFGEPLRRIATDTIIVDVLSVTPAGDVIAGGPFSSAGSTPGTRAIARWDGGAWHSLGGGLAGGPFGGLTWVYDIAILPDGDIIACGTFDTAGGVSALNVARWTGSEWAAMEGGVDSTAVALALLPNGDLVIGGAFQAAGGRSSPYLATWRDCPPCYADCDRTGDLTFFDFLCFQNVFATGDLAADCDASGELDFFDFLCFQNAFGAGCP